MEENRLLELASEKLARKQFNEINELRRDCDLLSSIWQEMNRTLKPCDNFYHGNPIVSNRVYVNDYYYLMKGIIEGKLKVVKNCDCKYESILDKDVLIEECDDCKKSK